MMLGLKEICALLAAGAIGVGGTVAVQHAKPTVTRSKARPAKAAKPRIARSAPAPLQDCPSVTDMAVLPPAPLLTPMGSPGGGLADLGVVAGPGFAEAFPGASLPTDDPGLPPLPAPEPLPPVPEPAAWAMLVTGFGLVGAALRGNRAPRIEPAG
jgi:hypothetical protein